jgi:hypothetical protein
MMSQASSHMQAGALACLSLLRQYAFDFHFTSFLEISPYIITAQLKKLISEVVVTLPPFSAWDISPQLFSGKN